ncbi:endonuclease III [Candidatus Micrarchaeota archaeon]|nr:endonuclease III [Candidatus Micrarchaeota archaeon]
MKLSQLGSALKIMQTEARERNAPVLRVESAKTTPFRALVFVMLSARTKDDTTLRAVERLFAVADTPEKIAGLKTSKLETLLYGVGFYRVKSKNLIKTCNVLIEKFNSRVPDTLEELLTLPGIGRKSANIVLARCFGKHVIGVDTHVHRIANRLGLVKTKKPEQTEQSLMRVVPKQYLRSLNKIFVAYGQTICQPVSPWCSICKIRNHCPRIGVKRSR